MTTLRIIGAATAVLIAAFAPAALFAADDGPVVRRNLSKTPELHSESASIGVMPLYVPAQNTVEESVLIEYLVGDCTAVEPAGCTVVDTKTEAKPLVAAYLDGEVTFIEGLAFVGHGRRDAFAALSLDDGATWKTANLSGSGDLSSFTLDDGTDYAGDVIGVSMAVVGNRVLVAWQSRYCDRGKPLYSWPDDEKNGLLATYPELGHPVNVLTTEPATLELYVDDLFGVTGPQRSSDYGDEGYPEVGEVPYACLWTARGTLEQAVDKETGEPIETEDKDPVYEIAWRAPERVTSGVHDVNLVQVAGTGGAGFVMVWQEDPDGLRPGKGLCADGGFNGAVAHHGTDIWYTRISWDHFDDVCTNEPDQGFCTTGAYGEFVETALLGQKPVAAVPMAVPVRLSDSELCGGVLEIETENDAYCFADFDEDEDEDEVKDLCASTVGWVNPGGTTLEVCETEDGRVLTGRLAATRPRVALKPYDLDGDPLTDGTGAWVVVIHERNKAMGVVQPDEEEEPIDIGKDIWYRTFDMFDPELVQQGMILNGPALDRETGLPFDVLEDEFGNEYHETEISRHANLAVQGVDAAMASESKTSAVLVYKQGIINQAGPADIFMHRVVLPDVFDPTVDNPFAYENVQCVEIADDGMTTPVDRLYADGSNPNYVRGLCPAQGMNVSGTTIVACDGVEGDCADDFPWDGDADFPKVTEWEQTAENLNDPSWANPYDVTRDNQAFIDGDFVMLLYSISHNWKASTIGKSPYNLYARRSFDGGRTWTTLPASFSHIDGVTYSGDGAENCEWFGWGGTTMYDDCRTYGPGEVERARNLSQLTGFKATVIEPRHTPTGGALKIDYDDLWCDDDGDGMWENCGYTEAEYPEDIRDPSRWFASYGTGDASAVSEDSGPLPMDLYYSHAFNFGDDYDLVEILKPSGELVESWDWLAHGKRIRADDAELTASPDGSRLYAVWSQEDFDKRGDFVGSDAWWRRVFYDLDP